MTLQPVTGVRVRLVERPGMLGWDEVRVVCFAVAGAIGSGLGILIASVL
jgi:hypothetical protein